MISFHKKNSISWIIAIWMVWELNHQSDLWSLKWQCGGSNHFRLKNLICFLKYPFKGYKFSFKTFSLSSKWENYKSPKVARFITWQFQNFYLKVPKKPHFNVAPRESYKVYYNLKNGDSSQIWAMVNLVNLC